jgi:hypothetical protein
VGDASIARVHSLSPGNAPKMTEFTAHYANLTSKTYIL